MELESIFPTSLKSAPTRNQIVNLVSIALFWSIFISSAFSYAKEWWFPWLLCSRIIAVLTGLTLAAWLTTGRLLSRDWDTRYLLFSLLIQISHGVLEGPNSTDFYNYSGVWFLLLSLSYRGNYRTWKRTFLPLGIAITLLPLLLKSPNLVGPMGVFVDKFTMLIVGTVLGSIIARINATKFEALEKHAQSQQTLAQLAAQVAHDIRSPIAVLNVATGDLKGITEEKRVLIRSALERMNDIANGLLKRHRELHTAVIECQHVPESGRSEMLVASIITIVTEKQVQYGKNSKIYIKSNIDPSNYGLFSIIEPAALKNVLSNIINNSVEACSNEGNINVTLRKSGDLATIEITDNGPGIPRSIIANIGQKGVSFGKTAGSGIGLYLARKTIEGAGGAMKIRSNPEKGTQVEINLPLTTPPTWFIEKLKLKPSARIAVIDDDQSIHLVWKERFKEIIETYSNIECYHFSSLEDFRSFTLKHPTHSDRNLFLVDYEFLGSSKNGLDLIEELHIESSSVLVTSRDGENTVRTRCEKVGNYLLPKQLAPHVPIEVVQA